MSLRKKACSACVASKRRCDQGQPACRRCTRQQLACEYPHAPSPFLQETHRKDASASSVATEPTWTSNLNDPVLLTNDTSPSDHVFDDLSWGTSWDTLCPQFDFSAWNTDEFQPFQLVQGDKSVYSADRRTPTPSLDVERPQLVSGRQSQSVHKSKRQKRYEGLESSGPSNYSSVIPGQTGGNHWKSQSRWPMLVEFWPRVKEVETWTFCARELVSYINTFATTASTHFIASIGMRPHLTAALGVCAAHETLVGPARSALGPLIDKEVDHIVTSAAPGTALSITSFLNASQYDVQESPVKRIRLFREDLARVQALTLYHIMGAFSSDAHQKRQAEQHEPLLASWTTSLQLRLKKLDQDLAQGALSLPPLGSPASSLSEPAGSEPQSEAELGPQSLNTSQTASLRKEEIETAHRTILISYFVRAVYAVMAYGICPLILDLEPLMVFAPASLGYQARHDESTEIDNPSPQSVDQKMLSYKELLELWEQGLMSRANLDDQYTKLLIVACKGSGILSSGS